MLKRIVDYKPASRKKEFEAFNDYSAHQLSEGDFDYFNPTKLGKREIKTKDKLFNQQEFQQYWGKKIDSQGNPIKLYRADDLDEDGIEDYLAYNQAQKRFVGYNNKIVDVEGKSTRPYRSTYMKKTKEERKKLPYKIWLDDQDPKEGFGPTKKAAPTKGLIGLIYNHFADWYESTSLQSYVKNAILNRILKEVIDAFFTEEFEDEQVSIQAKKLIYKQTPQFKSLLNKVLRKYLGVILPIEDKSSTLQLMYYLLFGSYKQQNEHESKLEVFKEELGKKFKMINTKEPVLIDEQKVEADLKEYCQAKAVTKFKKAYNLSAYHLTQLPTDAQTAIAKLTGTIYNELIENAKRQIHAKRSKEPRSSYKRDLSSAFYVSTNDSKFRRMEEESETETETESDD